MNVSRRSRRFTRVAPPPRSIMQRRSPGALAAPRPESLCRVSTTANAFDSAIRTRNPESFFASTTQQYPTQSLSAVFLLFASAPSRGIRPFTTHHRVPHHASATRGFPRKVPAFRPSRLPRVSQFARSSLERTLERILSRSHPSSPRVRASRAIARVESNDPTPPRREPHRRALVDSNARLRRDTDAPRASIDALGAPSRVSERFQSSIETAGRRATTEARRDEK